MSYNWPLGVNTQFCASFLCKANICTFPWQLCFQIPLVQAHPIIYFCRNEQQLLHVPNQRQHQGLFKKKDLTGLGMTAVLLG